MCFKFLDVVTIFLNYCGPKLSEGVSSDMKEVIKDLIIIIGYFCANNRKNQVRIEIISSESCSKLIFPRIY